MNGYVHITRVDIHLHAGIDSPICGWHWIEGREHPQVDLRITLCGPGFRSTTTLGPKSGNALREVCKYAMGR